jgi:Protein of unknown function (DUF4236)
MAFSSSPEDFARDNAQFSKSGVSTSVGWRGYHKTFSRKGVRTTAGIPGTGLSFTEYTPNREGQSPKREGKPREIGCCGPLLLCIIVGVLISVCHSSKPGSSSGVSTTPTPSAAPAVESTPIVEATPESTATSVTVKRAELIKLPAEEAVDTSADEDLNRAWHALTPAQRRRYRQEERDWIKHRDSLPTVQERNESTRKRAEYIWSLTRKD